MKCMTGLLFLATLTSTLPVDKSAKAFSLFNLLSFPNDECVTTSTPPMNGLCLTASECTAAGGEVQGNCAAGFGSCCFISVEATGTIITNNITHIQNAGYPDPIGNVAGGGAGLSTQLTFRLAGSSEICWTRLDFVDVVLQQPTFNGAAGNCGGTNGDSLQVTSPTTTILGFDSLCGTLTGHHIYIPNSVNLMVPPPVNDAGTVTINIGAAFFDRRWKIKTSRIECNNPGRPDEGCLQYFTGRGGRVQSFNNLDTSPMMISNLLYFVCIRQEDGFCGFTVSQTRTNDAPDSFHLEQSNNADNAAHVDANCANEFIGILSTKVDATRYCGGVLASTDGNTQPGRVPSDITPFRISVVTDAGTARTANTGFDLTYRQTTCS